MSHDIPFIDDENPHKPASCSGARDCGFGGRSARFDDGLNGK